jgi:hypothetical protein
MSPTEWLLSLAQRRDGHRHLLDRAGSLAVAAHALAQARCRASELASEIPTTIELRGAAREIARRCQLGAIPSGPALADDCAAAGLLVI